jgi:hypothetical protein
MNVALPKGHLYGGYTFADEDAYPDRGRPASPTARLTRKADGSRITGSPGRRATTWIPPTMPWFGN